jgi:hypothetical protein
MSVRSRTFRHVMRGGLIGLLATSATQMAHADGADTKKSCVSSFERAQQLRASTKLRDAREALIECSKETCPNLIRRDCVQWMGEVLASLPSVVFGAEDAEGKDVAAVRVSVDGVVVQERLEGKAIPIDPGLHVVRFELGDGTVLEERVLVREGEKNRALLAKFSKSAGQGLATPTATQPPSSSLELAPEGSPRSSPANLIVAIASGVVGLGALGASLAFDVAGTSEAHALPCAPAKDCTDSQIEPARQKYEYADILLGVGAVTVALGVVALVVRPFHAGDPRTGSRLQLDAGFSRGGGAAWLRLAF